MFVSSLSAQTMFEASMKMNSTAGEKTFAASQMSDLETLEQDTRDRRQEIVDLINSIPNSVIKAEFATQMFNSGTSAKLISVDNNQAAAQTLFDDGSTLFSSGQTKFYAQNYSGAMADFNAASPKFVQAACLCFEADGWLNECLTFFNDIEQQINNL